LRTRAATFVIVTIAFMFMMQLLAENLVKVTGGGGGLGLPYSHDWGGDFFNTPYYYAMLLLAVLGALVMRTEAMGLGDVKLAVFVGLIVGFPGTFNALLYGILLAGFISILLIAVRVKGLKDTIAYGPYLCAGALIQLFVQG